MANRADKTKQIRTRREVPAEEVPSSASVESLEVPDWGSGFEEEEEDMVLGRRKIPAGTRVDGESEVQEGGQCTILGGEDGKGGEDSCPLIQDSLQEGTTPGDHRGAGQLPHLGLELERGPRDEHVLGTPWPPHHLQVEGVCVDAACSRRRRERQGPLASEPSLAEQHVLQGGGSGLGPSGGCDPHTLRAARTAAVQVTGSEGQAIHTGAQPWKRGQVQTLKRGIKQVRKAMSSLACVAQFQQEPCWRVLEIFGGSAALSFVARSTGRWIALEPVDLMAKEQRAILQAIDAWEPD